MAVTCKDYLLMNDSVAEAKRKFQASPRISLPLLDGNGNLHGVVWCKDLLDADTANQFPCTVPMFFCS